MNQKEFETTIRRFNKIEDARDQLWDRAQTLIKSGFELEAYVLILATWNFARFRYFMKTFDLQEFTKTIKTINPVFEKRRKVKFEDIDFDDSSLMHDIKFIYSHLKHIAEQTGASKIMALKNPNLFVMWDTNIRRLYRINNEGTPDDYIEFLKNMKGTFKDIKWKNGKSSFAKAIDEYNYVKTQEK